MEQIDRIARYVAAQGRAEVVRLADIAERAGRLLDDPEFITDPSVKALVRPPPFPWEGQSSLPSVRLPPSFTR